MTDYVKLTGYMFQERVEVTGGVNRNHLLMIIVIMIFIVFYGGYRYGQAKAIGIDEVVIELAGAVNRELPGKEAVIGGEENREPTLSQEKIFVHITGAVQYPGVYQLPEGSRVNDGVQLAVPAGEADLDKLNLAQVLVDGNKVIVPDKQDGVAGTGDVAASNGWVEGPGVFSGGTTIPGKLNINIAGMQELADRLPGIGPVLAQRIIDYRTQNGSFQSPQEITKVSGIGPITYENIKELIVVR